MRTARRTLALVLAAAFAISFVAPAARAQQIQVIVDGSPVFFDQPPVTVGGRVLVPLRGVFERLGAFVQWNPQANAVIATRGTTQVQLTIGSRQAFVNGAAVVLDVPAMIISGRTLVPLRFVSEAMGARVDWSEATRTVMVISAPSVAQPPVPQPPPPPPGPSVIEGTVIRVDVQTAPQRLLVQRGDQVFTIIVTADTAITRVDAATGQGGAASLTEIRPGDTVTVTIDAQNRAILVRARGVAATPPPVTGGQIASFTHNASRPLRAGETIMVTLRGTSGGTATFDIFGVVSGIEMREVNTGVYRGTYRVRPGDNVANAVVFGHLRFGGVEATPIQAGTPVTFDTQPPVITGRFPEPSTTVANARPNILITFQDQGSAGINPSASAIVVNGQNVTASATVTGTAIAYNPPSALSGTVSVQTILRDRAGNETQDAFAFTIGVVQGAMIRAVTVNPTTPLQAGQTLAVTMVGEPGGQASFSIEGVVDNVPMMESANQPGAYFGQYTVRVQDNMQDARVVVTLTRAGQTVRAEATPRLIILGQVSPAPTILAPAPGTRVGSPIVIRGRALPGTRVLVRVAYQGTLLLFNVRGTYGEVTTVADAGGNWQVSINPSVRIPNARVTITAVAIDAAGRSSTATAVEVTQS